MKVVVLSVGRPRDPVTGTLHDLYAGRIRKFGVGYESSFVAEVKAGSAYTDDHVREREASLLEGSLHPEGTVIALDPGGSLLTTEEVASRFERWATPRATFVLGGPLGLGETIRNRSGFVWSLSPLTFPHEIARVLVVEQIYRALTILRRVPYHK